MMRLPRRTSLLVAFSLLTWAATAHAECACISHVSITGGQLTYPQHWFDHGIDEGRVLLWGRPAWRYKNGRIEARAMPAGNLRVVHLDCQRPHDLSREERILLFRYCWGHAVAKCPARAQSVRQYQLDADLLGHRSHLWPRGRTDLTESLRGHLYACTMLPEEVRRRAQEARDAEAR